MKARFMNVPFTVVGLLLIPTCGAVVQAQSAPNDLVTVATNAPTVSAQPATGFVLKPVGIVREVEKLAQSGADPGVIGAFIQSWQTPYSVNADDVLHLHAVGVPSDILRTLILHGAELSSQVAAANPNPAATAPYPEMAPPQDQPLNGLPPVADEYAPQPSYPVEPGVDTYPAYPVYDYSYGYAGPYYYPGVVIGGGIVVRGYHGAYGGFRGHGFEGHGSFGGHAGGFSGHAGNYGGHGGSFGGQGGGFAGHGAGFGGHGGTFGGRPGGGTGGHGSGFGGHAGGGIGGHGGGYGGHGGSSGHGSGGHR